MSLADLIEERAEILDALQEVLDREERLSLLDSLHVVNEGIKQFKEMEKRGPEEIQEDS